MNTNNTNFELIDNENLINQTCLFNSRPIVLNRDLAIILGDSDLALIFQQIHYWININKQNAEKNMANINTYHEGRFWCFQTYEQWEKEFEWISYRTLRRKFQKLEKLGLIISGNFNKMNLDKTKWYTIDYKKLLELQNQMLPIKLAEKQTKKNIRKEKEKIAIQKFKNNKNSNISEMSKMDISRNVHFGHLQMSKMDIAIQKTNIQKINYIQKINKDSQSVLEEKKEINNRQTDRPFKNISNDLNNILEQINSKSNCKNQDDNLEQNIHLNNNDNSNKENFKIEIENQDDELNNFVTNIANELLATQKTVNVSNKKIDITKIIKELKTLNKSKIQKLIDYVANKFKTSNAIIKNQTKYITSIFVNALFEKSYLLCNLQVGSSLSTPTMQIKQDNFVNYTQPKLDFKKLRELEIKSLKGEI